MMIGVAFSLGTVSTRITPSIGSTVPRWAVMSSSAGNDMGIDLLCDNGVLRGSLAEKVCEWRDLVRRALDRDDRGPVDVERGLQCRGKIVDPVDVDRRQAGEHGGQAGTEPARAEAVVAVEVAVEQLLSSHTHRVRVVVEQEERHRQAVLQRS